MAAKQGSSNQNQLEDKLNHEIEKLKINTEFLALKLSLSTESSQKSELNLEKAKKENVQLKEQCTQLIENMEQVTMSVVNSMKAYQSESRANLFEVHTQLQNKEKLLEESNQINQQLREKIDELKSQSLTNQMMFEVHLRVIHVNYVNILENVFEKLQQQINDELVILAKDGQELQQKYVDVFKKLKLPCTFHNLEN